MSVWVQLYNVPLELYTRRGLSCITSAIGIPLYMDTITASRGRLEYAKVCIEVKAGAKIPKTIDIQLRDGVVSFVRVNVPWMPQSCANCNSFGHLTKVCVEGAKPHQEWRVKASAPGEGKEVDVQERVMNVEEGSFSKPTDSAGIDSLTEIERFNEFPSLQMSQSQQKKHKVLTSVEDDVHDLNEGRKVRTASLGVANLFQEMKMKKKDHIGRAKRSNDESVVSTGGNLLNSSP
ncbi:hypothetical protein V6N13_102357 [Hibiscus sabdariffa]